MPKKLTERQQLAIQFLDQFDALERKECDAASWLSLKFSIDRGAAVSLMHSVSEAREKARATIAARDAQRLDLWPELLRQLDRASDLLSVCDLDAPSDVADMADIRQTLARARELR
jgi:hypothetical protein